MNIGSFDLNSRLTLFSYYSSEIVVVVVVITVSTIDAGAIACLAGQMAMPWDVCSERRTPMDSSVLTPRRAVMTHARAGRWSMCQKTSVVLF